ncbi:MAG: TldD/PmbA family protein [Cyanobacteria bacterium NC_groundwater_1444_Ag_S-0.65um_54_12]|nr:TldD/PmbA family protein [Cyanobacteria bacterium NC_groundwater_1444_Ag_S-0.65um_54_12]
MPTDIRSQLERAIASSPAEATEFVYSETSEGSTRFGADAITQNVVRASRSLSIRVQHAGREARVAITQMSPAAISRGIQEAMAVANQRMPDPDLLPMLDQPQEICPVTWPAQLEVGPEERATAIVDAITACQRQQARAGGICSSTVERTLLLNSFGIAADGHEYRAEFSLTAEAVAGSGWAKSCAPGHHALDFAGVTSSALDKALASRSPRQLPPGDYPVVLESAAVADLIKMFPWLAFSALDYLDGRHFAVGRLGEQFFDPELTITDDAWEVPGLPFDYEGVAKKRTPLIENGRLTGLVHDRHTARRMGVIPTGHGSLWPNPYGPNAGNLAVSGGEISRADVLAGLDRGLLITQLHYLNVVDRMDLSLTGMTRNGTFWIEQGRIAYPVQNLRFTDSLLSLFGNIDAISRERDFAAAFWEGTVLVPTMRLPRMHFSSLAGF